MPALPPIRRTFGRRFVRLALRLLGLQGPGLPVLANLQLQIIIPSG
jgi:hypothetical protein